MRSMTAYASVHQRSKSHDVQVIVRSLNFKYLDIAIRNLPAEDMFLEEGIKREIKKRIQRGKIEVFIFASLHTAKKIYIDEHVVARYVSQMRTLARKYKLAPEISIGDIVKLPQVVTLEDRVSKEQMVLLPVVRQALDKLIVFKTKQGEVIRREIMGNIQKLRSNVQKISQQKPKPSEMENGKEDIDEELSLLGFYVQKLEHKLNVQPAQPKGKSIDFLTQEILRELNAASSKTKKKNAALLIVEAKNYLERIREQAQNIE